MRDSTIRVLLFEDDFESMRDLKEYLEQELNWTVELTAARTVVDQLARERFDLLMVDLMIHAVSLNEKGEEVDNVHFDGIPWLKTGLEFLRRLRQGDFCTQPGVGTPSDVPVLILSAIAGSSVTDELDPGVKFSGFVEKPYRFKELVERMTRLIQGGAAYAKHP